MANRGSKDMRTYPAIFSKDEAGIAVEFPDLPGCFTCGKSEEEAVARALGLDLTARPRGSSSGREKPRRIPEEPAL